jgi:hydrogenase expression/formation protein HypD
VVGRRPFEFIPREYGKPIVVAGFEPLDVLQAVHMILPQLAEGRCEVENQYTRVVPYEGNLAALEVMAEVFELRPALRVARHGLHLPSGLKLVGSLATSDAERRFACPGCGWPTRGGQCGEVLKGVIQAVRVQGVRQAPAPAERRLGDLAWCRA